MTSVYVRIDRQYNVRSIYCTVDTVSFHYHGITNIENFFHLITLKKIPVDKVKFFRKDRNYQISSLYK
jgi:hypothetical protein